jgi:hypothetical protein
LLRAWVNASAAPTAVGNKVPLEEPRPHIRPVGEGANGNLPLQQRAGSGGTDATPRPGLLAERLERAIDGSRAHLRDTRLGRDRELPQCLSPTQPVQQFGQKRRETLGTDAVGHQPAQPQQFNFVRSVARRTLPCAFDAWLIRWWVREERQRVLPCVASHLTHLVEDLTLLGLAHVPVPRRQRPHQIMPTGSLHCLTDLAFGRILS